MRQKRMTIACIAVALITAHSTGVAVPAHAYAPDVDAPAVAKADGQSAISISTTNNAQKGSLPENISGSGGARQSDGDVTGEDGAEDENDAHGHGTASEATPMPEAAASIKDVTWEIGTLPEPVKVTRDKLLSAARSGDIEALRPIFKQWGAPPIVAGFEDVADPVDHLRLQSGDAEGREILAILLELLESGHVHVGDAAGGTYVWPYFAEVPLEELKDPHYVELYRILTAIDVEEIERIGRYTFFRVGISADGRLRYFTAGDME